MKQKMSTKALRSLASSLNATVYSVGYADLQYLLDYKTPHVYTAGIYGWNYDCYWLLDSNNKDVFINTGYRGTFGKSIDWKIVEEYDKKASEIYNEREYTFEEKEREMDKLILEFLNKIA